MARDSLERTKLNFDNAFKEAQLQNSSILAEIALNAQKEQLEFALSGLQYKNNLLEQKASAANQIKSVYNNKWQTVLDQINTEKTIAEQARQFDLKLAEDQRQFDARYGDGSYGYLDNDNQHVRSLNQVASDSGDAKRANTENVGKVHAGFLGTTYKQALDFLIKNGVRGYDLMSEVEWKRQKDIYKKTGKGSVEVSANETYADYLRTATTHAILNK
jgi:hypothetical protein